VNNSKEGARLFNEQKYAEAIKVFEKVIEKDPKNANAAYNIAISYIQLKDDDNALIYLNKATDINKFYYDAWYNMAILEFNKGEYKKAVMASLTAGQEGRKIIYKYFLKLKEAGFPNRDYSQIIENYSIPQNDFVIEANEKNIYFTLLISKDGKVEKVSCGKEKDLKEKEICDFYVPFLSSLEFISAFDFYKNEMKSSEEIGFLILSKDEKKKNRLRMVNGIETIPEDNNIKHGAVDRSDIDASVKKNLSKIRWCYEKELTKNSSLNGRIAINFIIDEDGSVPVAKIYSSTMNNKNVETCVADQIKKIQFPAPKGGGIVIVNYPFVFKYSEE